MFICNRKKQVHWLKSSLMHKLTSLILYWKSKNIGKDAWAFGMGAQIMRAHLRIKGLHSAQWLFLLVQMLSFRGFQLRPGVFLYDLAPCQRNVSTECNKRCVLYGWLPLPLMMNSALKERNEWISWRKDPWFEVTISSFSLRCLSPRRESYSH